MGKAKNATKPPTDAEIWDDSALVRTWDEAVEEYKLYHSIHAKGEDIEDVLREAEDEETCSTEHTVTMGTDAKSSGVLEKDVDETGEQQQKPSEESPNTGPGSGPGPGAGTGSVGAATMPHPALSSVQDEGLKNLMMSWYFAGYYTGLYEGQQQAKS